MEASKASMSACGGGAAKASAGAAGVASAGSACVEAASAGSACAVPESRIRDAHCAGPLVFDPSANVSFGAFDAGDAAKPGYRSLRAVVIGGGTGAPMSIRAACALGCETSAVVAMADDGGSTGIIRSRTQATPPGDIRKCLAAFAPDPADPFVRAFSSRLAFDDDHALGNLLLVALEETAGGFMEAIALCERLLGAAGHVYPCTLDHVEFRARTCGGALLEGQKDASHSSEALRDVWLASCAGEPAAQEGARAAIAQADVAILGPGSLFTSVISNLAVPGIAAALRESDCLTVYVCPVADTQGETRGMDAADHVRALERHGLAGAVDVVLVNDAPLAQPAGMPRPLAPVRLDDAARAYLAAQGIALIESPLADETRPSWHNPMALCRALAQACDLRISGRS